MCQLRVEACFIIEHFLQDSKVVPPTPAKMDLHAKLTSAEKLIASKYYLVIIIQI